MSEASFVPIMGATVNINVSAASQAVSFGRPGVEQVRIMNNGTATVWVAFGTATVTAALATAMPVGPGVTEVVSFPSDPSDSVCFAAAIAAGATGNVYFTPGEGI